MSSLFVDTHNVVAILEKSDAVEGFEQIIDFLSGSYIHYALIVNPHIYISCIKQFWNTDSVKLSGDITRLQALVDKKKIAISEVVIREILQLDDAEGVVCLQNEEIFAGLAQMGYEKPSTKLTSYKAFFSSQWKFLIHTILQSLSAKRTSWNEFSTTMASTVICLSKGQKFKFSKYIFDSLNQVGDLSTHTTRFISPALTQKVFANMRRVGKGFSGVETPLFEGMLVDRQPAKEELGAEFPTQIQQVLNVCSALTKRVKNLENDNAAQKLVIIKLKARLKKLEKANMVKSSKLRRLRKVGAYKQVESSDDMEDVFNQGRMIDDMDKDEGIKLVKDAEVAESKGRHATKQAKNQAEIYHIDLDHSSKVLSMQEDDLEVQEVVEVVTTAKLIIEVVTAAASQELSLKTPAETPAETPKVKDKGKGIMVETPKPMKKKDQIELDAEYARKLHEEINRDEFNKDIDWDAAMDHTESEARKNMMIYLKNIAGYKMDFFKGMNYAQICQIFQARFNENMRFLFKSKEEIEEKDQEIIKSINETPAQKAAKRRKMSEEAQEAKDLRKRLEVVDDEDDDVFIEATPITRKVPIVDYQIVLVDNKPRFKIIKADETHQYPLSRFTLEQLVNVTRLQAEKESEMSLELLRAIISDRGTHFCNDKFDEVMSKYGVTHRLATAYHPLTNKLDDALWTFRTTFKTPIGCTPYKLVYGKSCHLPIELEHKAYWALKHANFDLKTVGDHRKLQLNELNEHRDQAYENSLIYKERTKKLHDSKIKNSIFNVGDRVLLFNSHLKIFSRKHKTRWSGPFTITKVFPYGTIELSQPDGPNFKVNGHRVKHYFRGDVP
nr:reverse transcriptase domain-containing protein [Tanacetum cinerariifolium]